MQNTSSQFTTREKLQCFELHYAITKLGLNIVLLKVQHQLYQKDSKVFNKVHDQLHSQNFKSDTTTTRANPKWKIKKG